MTKGNVRKTNTLDEVVLNERTDARGNPAKTSMFLHEDKKTKEKLIRLAEAHKTKTGKWNFFGYKVFFLPISLAIKFIKGLFNWSGKYQIDLTELEEFKKESTDKLSKELKSTKMELEKAQQTIIELSSEISKREEEFKRKREDEFSGEIPRFKKEIEEFENLIKNFEVNKKKEEDLQKFIETHPWFLGLFYKNFEPQKLAAMERFDFYLKRFDDSEEVIELKRVDVNFTNKDGSINSDFAQALDQMLSYFDEILNITFAPRLSEKYKIHEFYPRGILIFGFNPDKEAKDFINKWRNALRIEIMTYDQVLEKFKVTVQNLEKKKQTK